MFSWFGGKTESTAGNVDYSGPRDSGNKRYALRGRFNADRLPTDARSLGLPERAGGLFLGFVPPYAAFQNVADGLQRAVGGSGPLTVATLSSTGALCSGTGSAYCGAETHDREGSFLWLSDEILEKVELFAVDLKVGQGHTVSERVELIGRELQRVTPSFDINARDTFALIFCDGLSASEGFLMRAWYESKRFPCLAIGGSAGGKLDFSGTYIHDGRRTLTGHALVIFCKVKPGIRFSAFKSQNFNSTGKSWLVADADPVARTVTSVFADDGRPVPLATALAEHFRCAPGDVEKQLATHTFAVSVGDEMFIRSVAKFGQDVTAFFCDIEFGDRLFLMKQTDFIATTQRDWQQFVSGKGQPLAMLLNDCVLRRVGNPAVLGQAAFFSETPAAGFSTFGEFLGIPMNQTLSALVFFPDAPGYSDPFMNAFPVAYAAFSTHYTQRALEQWKATIAMRDADDETGAPGSPADESKSSGSIQDFNHLVALLLEKERELEAGRHHLSRLAHHDPLTGLPNRALLEDRLQRTLAYSERNEREAALLFCDLDGFKQINDQYGHDVGDKLLCAVAGRLSEGRRRIDTVARLGGDEFVILLGDLPDAREGAQTVARQCLRALEKPFEIGGYRVKVGISIGIAVHRMQGSDAAHLLSQADSAMYDAKRSGKGGFAFFKG
jgi:diguanylate cyclase (GGDEF)-like protein